MSFEGNGLKYYSKRSFIDTAKPVQYLKFRADLANPAWVEGMVFYDMTEKTLSYYNDKNGVTVNLGQEMHIRAINLSGSPIANGAAVYVSGASGDKPQITLARADSPTTSEAVIGLTTHASAHGDIVYVTTLGLVHDLDTSSFNSGDRVYLSTSSSGTLTSTRPTGTNKVVGLGIVTRKNASNGHILVFPEQLGYATLPISEGGTGATTASAARQSLGALVKKNGIEDKSLVSISYRADTRTVTLTYSAGFAFWVNGVRYTKTGSESLAHDTTNGKHYFYYNSSGTLVDGTTPWNIFITAQICQIYYKHNATPALAKALVFEERHPGGDSGMGEWEHRWGHLFIGSQISTFPVISGYTLDNSANVAYAVSGCNLEDEDLQTAISAQTDGGTYPMLWVDSAGGTWDWDFTTSTDGLLRTGGNAQYNNTTLGTLVAITSNSNWHNMWPIALPILGHSTGSTFTAYSGYMYIVGQNVYTTLANAQAVTPQNLLYVTNITDEGVVFARITYTRRVGVFEIDVDPVYFRGSLLSITATSFTPTDHQSLSNRTASNVHPGSSIQLDTTNFTNELTVAETTSQLAFDKLSAGNIGIPANQSISAAGTIAIPTTPTTWKLGILRVQGNAASITTGVPGLANGTIDGQIVHIIGLSDANSVTINPSATVDINGTVTLGDGDVITLTWITATTKWVEISRNF